MDFCCEFKIWSVLYLSQCSTPDNKVHGTNMGPIWVLSAPGGPHAGPMNLAIWDYMQYHDGLSQWHLLDCTNDWHFIDHLSMTSICLNDNSSVKNTYSWNIWMWNKYSVHMQHTCMYQMAVLVAIKCMHVVCCSSEGKLVQFKCTWRICIRWWSSKLIEAEWCIYVSVN